MARKQRLELNFSDVEDFHFKAPLKGYLIENAEDHFVIVNDDLSIRATGKTPKEAAENIKEQFMILANDVVYKSKYAALSERERKKFNIIKSVCDIL